MIGTQHPEPAAEVRVPDVAAAIHGDAERPSVASRQTKFRDAALAESSQPPTPELREPDGPVGRRRQRGEAGQGRGHGELRELAVRRSEERRVGKECGRRVEAQYGTSRT